MIDKKSTDRLMHDLNEAKVQCEVYRNSLSASNIKNSALLGENERVKAENLSLLEKSHSLDLEKKELLMKLKSLDERRLSNSTHALDEMLSLQKSHGDKTGLGYKGSNTPSTSKMVFVKGTSKVDESSQAQHPSFGSKPKRSTPHLGDSRNNGKHDSHVQGSQRPYPIRNGRNRAPPQPRNNMHARNPQFNQNKRHAYMYSNDRNSNSRLNVKLEDNRFFEKRNKNKMSRSSKLYSYTHASSYMPTMHAKVVKCQYCKKLGHSYDVCYAKTRAKSRNMVWRPKAKVLCDACTCCIPNLQGPNASWVPKTT